MSATPIAVAILRRDGGTQIRGGLDEDTVEQYAAAYCAGAVLPPVQVMYDGSAYWLWDGFHRAAAAELAHLDLIDAEITAGSQDDAIVASIAANKEHDTAARRRSTADKQRAVHRALTFHVTQGWTDGRIAAHCGVTAAMVGTHRKNLEKNQQIPVVTERTDLRGRTITTSTIGRTPTIKVLESAPMSAPERSSTPEPEAPVQAGESEGFTFGWLEFDHRHRQLEQYAAAAMESADLTPEAREHVLAQLTAWKQLFGLAMKGEPVAAPPPPPLPPPPAPKKKGPAPLTIPPLPENLDTPAFREALDAWIVHRQSPECLKAARKPWSQVTLEANLKKMAARGLEASLETLAWCLEKQTQGLIWPEERRGQAAPPGGRLRVDPAEDIHRRQMQEALKRREARSNGD